jgi:predicted ATPase/class 3 adenylate cyclase
MSQSFPSGTVTFLFTDIEGSTTLWEQQPARMESALALHDALLKEAIGAHGGLIVKTTGDGVHAVFASARDAIGAALAAQLALQGDEWRDSVALRIRMGVHTGEAAWRDGDYYGTAVNQAARLMSIAHGGQVLISSTAAQLTGDALPESASLLALGRFQLRGLERRLDVYQLQHPDLPAAFPPLRSHGIPPHNLPDQLTSFVGRVREQAAVGRLLAGESNGEKRVGARLVTLTGPGGTGKTRLALQVGRDQLSTFADGVWLVELAPLADPGLVTQAVASALNVREVPDRPLLELLSGYLRQRRLLLILDNCEHVIDACAALVAALLARCPGLTVLTSSREALGLAGEVIFRVPSLSVPDAGRQRPADASKAEAIQLFAERASTVQPAFSLTGENLPAVAEICRRLDGVPLAIELAAARTRLFTPQQIADRLDDRFRLLTGGSRTAMPRQQTLRALVDWSYDLLSEDEQMLFRYVSVFAGGWTFDAVETVCAELDVLELLSRLLDKSLVTMEDRGGHSRYRLLETLRQYARDRLFEAGEATNLRRRHLDYFHEQAALLAAQLQGPGQIEALQTCETELDNLRAALQWGLDHDPLAALEIAGQLHWFWSRGGHHSEGYKWLREALEYTEKLPSDEQQTTARALLRAKATLALSETAMRRGRAEEALTIAQEAVRLYRDTDQEESLTYALSLAALYASMRHQVARARELVQEALVLGGAGGSFWRSFALDVRAAIAVQQGDLKVARLASQEAFQLVREAQDPWGEAQALMALGRIDAMAGDLEQARSYFRQAASLFVRLHDRLMVNVTESEIAHLERRAGNLDTALAHYRRTLVVWQEMGMGGAVAHQLECIAYVAGAMGQALLAARLLGAASSLRASTGSPMTQPESEEFSRENDRLRRHMGEATHEDAWTAGQTLTAEQAVASALTLRAPA